MLSSRAFSAKWKTVTSRRTVSSHRRCATACLSSSTTEQPLRVGLAAALTAYTEFTEIEERELTNVRVKAAREEGERLNRLKDEFLAMVSHELRTPLQSILGWARLLRSGHVSSEQIGKALETIERNALVQSQLIEDILDVSRIITGKVRIHSHVVDVAMVLASGRGSAGSRAPARRGAHRIRTPRGSEASSRAGPARGASAGRLARFPTCSPLSRGAGQHRALLRTRAAPASPKREHRKEVRRRTFADDSQ